MDLILVYFFSTANGHEFTLTQQRHFGELTTDCTDYADKKMMMHLDPSVKSVVETSKKVSLWRGARHFVLFREHDWL